MNQKQIDDYLAARRAKFPTTQRIQEQQEIAKVQKDSGIFRHPVQAINKIPTYKQEVVNDQVILRQAKLSVYDSLKTASVYQHLSLLSECIQFIHENQYLQGPIPEKYRFTYQPQQITVVGKPMDFDNTTSSLSDATSSSSSSSSSD